MVTVCVTGDVLLDVLVRLSVPLVEDDDVPARIALTAGGQAANVACWAARLGARARLYGPRGTDPVGRLVADRLAEQGVGLVGPESDARTGTVLSLASGGRRTMASDPGDLAWIGGGLTDSGWMADADWLHVSGYLALRAPDPAVVVALADSARTAGARVSLDLASAAMLLDYGSRAFAGLLDMARPDVVQGNEAEWDALGLDPVAYPGVAVVKRGAAGVSIVEVGRMTSYDALPAEVVDTTGAGDAFAAGYLVGGVPAGLRAAAQCVATVGGQPDPG